MTSPYTIFPLGDSALIVDFGNVISEAVNRRVLALYEALGSLSLPHLTDLVPAYGSLAVYYDAVALVPPPGEERSAFDAVSDVVRGLLEREEQGKEQTASRHIKVPVCYTPRYGPDLEEMARAKDLSVDEIVRLHTAGTYKVYMLGFLPGFAYMGTVDERLAMERRPNPRPVLAGAVGIAGRQTGIYPLDSPGGWQIIGRTPLKLFHKKSEHPVLLAPGDTITFYSISEDEFAHY